MKKLNVWRVVFLLITASFVMSSCEDDSDKFPQYKVAIVNSGVDFVSVDHHRKTLELIVDAKSDCSISTEATWFSVDQNRLSKGKHILVLEILKNDGVARHDVIELQSGENTQTLVVQQNRANTTYDDVTHNFYVTFGTMPSLYAGLQLLKNDKTPSYFYFGRSNTYTTDQFPSHAVYIATGNDGASIDKAKKELKETILKINKENPDAIFGLTVDDLRSRVGYDWFVAQGIDSSRVKVTLVSDGSGSYNEFYNFYGDPSTAQSTWEKYEQEVNSLEWNAFEATKINHKDVGVDSYEWMAYMSTLPNYRYFLQDADLLETESPFMLDKMKEMNTVSIAPNEILEGLSNDKKELFHKMAKFDAQTIRSMFDESPKENLIIISTNPSSNIIDYVNETIKLYSEEYDIFMSVHPADGTSELLDKLQEEGRVKLFPKGLPFEVLLWSFMDDIHAIGGAQSTVFLTVPPQKVKFMYAKSAKDMVKPLNKLMAGQTHINWMAK